MSIVPELDAAQPIEIRFTVMGKETDDGVSGPPSAVTVTSQFVAHPEMTTRYWYDDRCWLVYARSEFGGVDGELTRIREDEVAAAGAEGSQPHVLRTRIPIVLSAPIDADTKTLRISLWLKDSLSEVPVMATDAYIVVSRVPGNVVVRASAGRGEPTSSYRMPCQDSRMKTYLASDGYLQSDHPEIRDLARKAVGEEREPFRAARQIAAYVYSYIGTKRTTKDWSTAVEVARSGAGDCTEHAVLCAAMARAVGIPARVVIGLSPVNTRYYGYHAWTEVHIGQWVTVDATQPSGLAHPLAVPMTDIAPDSPYEGLSRVAEVIRCLNAIDRVEVDPVR